MNASELIKNLILYYSLANMKELAEKINVSQSVVSSWKTRNSVGALINKIAEIDSDALDFILQNATNSTQTVVDNHGQLAHTTNGDQIYNTKEDTSKRKDNIDEATYCLFIEAYNRAMEDDKLNAFRIYLMEKNF